MKLRGKDDMALVVQFMIQIVSVIALIAFYFMPSQEKQILLPNITKTRKNIKNTLKSFSRRLMRTGEDIKLPV
jgi:hypothetical protein